MPDETDVTLPDSSSGEGTEAHAETAPVSGEPRHERTLDNVYGEFNRKFGKVQSQLDTVLQYIASQTAPRQQTAPPPGQKGERSMEELYTAASQGDTAAYQEYHRRLAAEEYTQRSQQDRKTQLIEAQLNTLVGRYPVLKDGSHPLTVASHAAYNMLIQNGYPADKATLLQAANTAISNNPEMVSEIYSQPANQREQQRVNATTRAQSGVTGASHRQSAPAQQAPKYSVNPAEIALAKRMGIKDPIKAKERFMKRQEDGQSSLGSVSAFVNENEF